MELQAKVAILDGLSQDAIDGGWTYRGMSAYAAGLEAKVAAQGTEISRLMQEDNAQLKGLLEAHTLQASSLQAKVAEQSAEIERLSAENRSMNEDVCHYSENEQTNLATIAQQVERIHQLQDDVTTRIQRAEQQAERIAELEQQRRQWLDTDLCGMVVRDQERTITEQAALIEKCRASAENIVRCFEAARAEGLDERLAEQPNDGLGTLSDLITRRLSFAEAFAIEALSAIAAQKGGAV